FIALCLDNDPVKITSPALLANVEHVLIVGACTVEFVGEHQVHQSIFSMLLALLPKLIAAAGVSCLGIFAGGAKFTVGTHDFRSLWRADGNKIGVFLIQALQNLLQKESNRFVGIPFAREVT